MTVRRDSVIKDVMTIIDMLGVYDFPVPSRPAAKAITGSDILAGCFDGVRHPVFGDHGQ